MVGIEYTGRLVDHGRTVAPTTSSLNQTEMMNFKNDLRAVLVWAALFAAVPAGAQTLTSGPAVDTVVTPAHDYAATQWQDPWDMKQRTDIGWFTWAVESESLSGMTSKGMTSYTGSP